MIQERLIMLRGQRTQQEVADALGISRARYSHYENGRNEPDLEILKLVADYHNVTVDYLLGREDKLREQKPRYKSNEELDPEAVSRLFTSEPETLKFWREFIKAEARDRKAMIRTWYVMKEMAEKEENKSK